MQHERPGSPGFTFKITSVEELYGRLRLMIDYLADRATSEERALMELLPPPLDTDIIDQDFFPLGDVTVPEYGKIIDADPLFREVNLGITGGYSIEKGDYSFMNVRFWFHSMAEQIGYPRELALKAPEVLALMKQGLQGRNFELEATGVSKFGDRDIVVRDINGVINGQMNFGVNVNATQQPIIHSRHEDEDMGDLISFELDLPTDRQEFLESLSKAQKLIQVGITSLYQTLGITPSSSMNLVVDFGKT